MIDTTRDLAGNDVGTMDLVPGKGTPKAKAAPKKAKPADGKQVAKGKAAVKATKSTGETIRLRVFRALSKKPQTGPQLAAALGLSGVPSLLKDEGVIAKARIRRKEVEGVRGVVYELTAAGKADLAKGAVDEHAAPASGGTPWPNGR